MGVAQSSTTREEGGKQQGKIDLHNQTVWKMTTLQRFTTDFLTIFRFFPIWEHLTTKLIDEGRRKGEMGGSDKQTLAEVGRSHTRNSFCKRYSIVSGVRDNRSRSLPVFHRHTQTRFTTRKGRGFRWSLSSLSFVIRIVAMFGFWWLQYFVKGVRMSMHQKCVHRWMQIHSFLKSKRKKQRAVNTHNTRGERTNAHNRRVWSSCCSLTWETYMI